MTPFQYSAPSCGLEVNSLDSGGQVQRSTPATGAQDKPHTRAPRLVKATTYQFGVAASFLRLSLPSAWGGQIQMTPAKFLRLRKHFHPHKTQVRKSKEKKKVSVSKVPFGEREENRIDRELYSWNTKKIKMQSFHHPQYA